MRTAAQLRQAAALTGTWTGPFLNYVGDGFTVPWQVMSLADPRLGFTFFAYKAYLDANFYEASRLHDWCYTPYGSLIGVTREEADHALFEEINRTSALDAEIVYRAVRFGGAPYFGKSQTGFVGMPPPSAPTPFANWPSNGRNMPDVSGGGASNPFSVQALLGDSGMATFKCVILFQQQTTVKAPQPAIGYTPIPRVGGWSESVWSAGGDQSALMHNLNDIVTPGGAPGLLPARAAMLSAGAQIIGVRLYAVGVGKGTFLPFSFPGSGGSKGDSDQPQAALLFASTNAVTNTVRRWTCRGVPDSQTGGGEFNPTPAFVAAVQTYLNAVEQFSYPVKTKGNVSAIDHIDHTGVMTLKLANTFALNQFVQVSGALDGNGIKRGGSFQVGQVGPGANDVTLKGWTAGDTTGGTAFILGNTMAALTSAGIERLVVKKVGRPFGGYRGRASKRRRKV